VPFSRALLWRWSRRIALLILVLIAAALLFLWWHVTQPLVGGRAVAGAAEAPPADPDRLRATVRLLSEELAPRHYLHLANLTACADHIAGELAAAGGRVETQTWTVDGRDYRNVRAFLGPETAERVVVGAHYDVADELPGADDNASAVAGLIELARLLAAAPPRATVELVAYCLEEPPFFRSAQMGSAQHAALLREQGIELRAMICLEMIGFFADEAGSQAYPVGLLKLVYPDRGDFITVVGRMGEPRLVRRIKGAMRGATPLPVESINAPAAIPGIDLSDHFNYWSRGYPAVMITDTSYYRNPHYHEASDTWSTLDYERMAQVVRGVHAATLMLAQEIAEDVDQIAEE